MKKIEISAEERVTIQQHLDGEVGMFTATQHQMDVLKPVISGAKELLLELDAFDEMFDSADGDLLRWYLQKWQNQQN